MTDYTDSIKLMTYYMHFTTFYNIEILTTGYCGSYCAEKM